MRVLHDAGKLDEAVVQTLAGTRQVNEVICAVRAAHAASARGGREIAAGRGQGFLPDPGQGAGWSWQTTKLLMALRSQDEQLPHLTEKSRVAFDTLSAATAQRVLRFVQVREQSQHALEM